MLAALALQGLAIRAIQGLLGASLPVKFQYSSPFADATRKRLARAKGTQKGGYGGVIIMWGIGYNQHVHGQHNVISIINLLTLTGNLAKPGCGPFSMTGQPNAMGERFTGGLTGRLPFNQPLTNAKHRKQMAKHWWVPEKNLINAMNSKPRAMRSA